jgi:hypothetical protein
MSLLPSFKRLLIYRFTIINSMFVAIVASLSWLGLTLPIFTNDASYLSYAIAGLFVLGWGWSLKEVLQTSWALDAAKVDGYPPAQNWDYDKAAVKTEWLENISEWLVGLGLLGTVVGFSIALSGIDQGSLMQAQGAQNSVGTLMEGMRTALSTTLLGAALAIWHQVNLRMLRTAFVSYWTERLRKGEYHR